MVRKISALLDANPALINRRLFEQAKQRRKRNPKSVEQLKRFSNSNTHGKTWNGQRSRFILSGLMKCSLCGCRYQGVTRNKGKKRLDGTRVKTFYYGCGGSITKGTNVCQMNAISKDVLEQTVINKVLEFYRPYLKKDGRAMLKNAVKMQVNYEGEELINARKRGQTELEKIGHTINNLLDNITPINREYVDQRLRELKQMKLQLDTRLEELERLSLSQDEIENIVSDADQFLSGLEFIFSKDLPQEKLVALRQCIEKIFIDKPAGIIKMIIRLVPVGNLEATEELVIRV